jgi:F0F1-type ATP synthase epsilon subunit
MRTRVGSFIAVAALVLVLAAPAWGQQAPTLGAPPTTDTTAQVAPSTTSSGGGGLKTWQEVLIFAAGLVLLTGIAIAILTDSRERAARLGHGRALTEPSEAPHRHKQRSKQRARQKAKAARAQRRRNR